LECYITPQNAAEIFMMAGKCGGFRMVECEMKILNTRLSMSLPIQPTNLTSTDKPYFKCFEDKQSFLYGHGILNQPAPQIYPSVNGVDDTNFHNTVTNMTQVPMPNYLHSVQSGALQDPLNIQLPIESTGGVEYYSPGDQVAFKWPINGRLTAIGDHQIRSDVLEYEWKSGTGIAANPRLCGFIGYTSPFVNYGRYPREGGITYDYTDGFLNSTTTPHPEEFCQQPPMVLLQCPTIEGVGDGGFEIQTNLQCTVVYSGIVEVRRMIVPAWNATALIRGTAPFNSSQIGDTLSFGERYLKPPSRMIESSDRTAYRKGNLTI
jgi:hypothetical protein